jgi:hypothetical protein
VASEATDRVSIGQPSAKPTVGGRSRPIAAVGGEKGKGRFVRRKPAAEIPSVCRTQVHLSHIILLHTTLFAATTNKIKPLIRVEIQTLCVGRRAATTGEEVRIFESGAWAKRRQRHCSRREPSEPIGGAGLREGAQRVFDHEVRGKLETHSRVRNGDRDGRLGDRRPPSNATSREIATGSETERPPRPPTRASANRSGNQARGLPAVSGGEATTKRPC